MRTSFIIEMCKNTVGETCILDSEIHTSSSDATLNRFMSGTCVRGFSEIQTLIRVQIKFHPSLVDPGTADPVVQITSNNPLTPGKQAIRAQNRE